jgi:hypothetical protein
VGGQLESLTIALDSQPAEGVELQHVRSQGEEEIRPTPMANITRVSRMDKTNHPELLATSAYRLGADGSACVKASRSAEALPLE